MTTRGALGADGLAAISKSWVTSGRTWFVAMRELAMAPWLSFAERDQAIGAALRPWLEMTRTAQDYWLDTYEAQAHRLIDQSFELFERAQIGR